MRLTSHIFDMTSSPNFFHLVLFLLSSLVAGPSFMSILSLVQELWQFLETRRLGQVTDTKFETNVSNKMLLHAAKCQSYSFYRFWVIKEKLAGGKINPPLPHTPRLGLRELLTFKKGQIPSWLDLCLLCLQTYGKVMHIHTAKKQLQMKSY